MCNVEVTADDDRLDGVQLREIFAKSFFPNATRLHLPNDGDRCRDIDVDKKIFAKV